MTTLANVKNAKDFAIKHHGEQMYGNYPYIYHLDSVAKKCVELYGISLDKDILIVAYLHDVLEDTFCMYYEIEDEFDSDTADAVLTLTKTEGENYKDYISDVKDNPISLKVKIADTLCNLEESVKIGDVKRIKKYTKQIELLCCD